MNGISYRRVGGDVWSSISSSRMGDGGICDWGVVISDLNISQKKQYINKYSSQDFSEFDHAVMLPNYLSSCVKFW